MSGTTFSLQSGLNRTEKREIKNRIKKIWNKSISELFRQDYDDICYITLLNDEGVFPSDLELGYDYDSVMVRLDKKQADLRLKKLKRITDDD